MPNDAIKEQELLVARIDMLTQNLYRVRDLLENSDLIGNKKDEEVGSERIRGKFASKINPLAKELDKLRTNLIENRLGPDGIPGAWDRLEQHNVSANQIRSQCLDFLGGLAVRRWRLENGFCDLSEKLVTQVSMKTGVTWASVMILGEERPFDDIAATTQIIRIRFPEWDIWSLPFIVYEYGQIVTRSSDNIDQFRDLFAKTEKQISDLIERPEVELSNNDLDHLADEFKEARQRYQAALAASKANTDEARSQLSEVKKETDLFIKKHSAHIRSLFSDILATFFMGPAYLNARVYLRLIPSQASEERPNQPSTEQRMAFIFETLKFMNKTGKVDQLGPGIYDEELARFQDLWSKSVKKDLPNFTHKDDKKNDLEYKIPYDTWFDDCFETLSSVCYKEGFEPKHWKFAVALEERLSQALPEPPEPTSNDNLQVILNAAWICRKKNPGKVAEISNAAYKMCEKVARPAQAPTDAGNRR